MTSATRKKILRLVAAKRLSYALIGKRFGVTRNVVAGIVFRERHPKKMLVRSPGSKAGWKTGRGYVTRSYDPEQRLEPHA